MHRTPEPDREGLDPASKDCLVRTRSAVLNVLVAVGLTIAVSGWLLRGWEPETPWRTAQAVHQGLTVAWVALGAASYLSLRILSRRSALLDPLRRRSRFFWSHIVPAAIGAVIAPLGLVQGWLCDPRLQVLVPFWVMPLTMGVLALPRASELAGFDRPIASDGAAP